MSKKDFEDLLKKHENKSEEKEIHWENQKKEWLHFIEQFYTSIESWFTPFKNDGKLSYSYTDTEITEEYLDTYYVKTMAVNFAGQKLTLEPIGTLLIGTKGRIDMEGVKGRVQFILADKNSTGMRVNTTVSIAGETSEKKEERKKPDWTWKIVLRESRRISYTEFNEENFFDALMEVVNG